MTLHGVPILADARPMIVQRIAKGMRNHDMSCVVFVYNRMNDCKEAAMTVPQRVLDTMNSGLIYTCDDEGMIKAQKEQMELLYDFNATRPSQMTQRNEIARQLLGEFGEDAYIEPPLHANWGCNTYFSAHAYANFNLTLVDDGEVHIGEHTMIGPNCTIITTGHPIRPDLREKVTQYSLPVTIGRNVWLGANVTVLPGVTIDWRMLAGYQRYSRQYGRIRTAMQGVSRNRRT